MKARFLALAALVLGMVSCQQDFDGVAPVGGEVDFQLTVAAPELSTRADEDGRNGHDSAFGAIDYLTEEDWAKVDLRYTLEVYDVKDGAIVGTAPVKDRMTQVVKEYTPVSFDLRLIPNRKYRFVVFADFISEDGKELHHEIGTTLQQITVVNDGINNEYTDAYFDFEDITISNSVAHNIVLRRPYGKVRVIATDLAELNLNVEPRKVVVEYESAHVNAFNAVTGQISGGYAKKSYSYDYAEIYKDVNDGGLAKHYYNEGYDGKTYVNKLGRHTHMTLFTDYILAEDQQNSIHFTMTVNDGQKDIKTTEFNTDIPVQRNHLTTIIGNVLTTATEINVTIDDNFVNADRQYYVFEAFVNGGEVTLDRDYVIGRPLFVDAEATLNLNGFSITTSVENKETDAIIVRPGGKLTINGEGTIEAVSGTDGYAVISEGELVINGGTFKAGVDKNGEANAVIYARGEGKVYVNGGVFPNEAESNFVLNKKDSDRANTTIEVRGGRFFKFDPANNFAENPQQNFVPEGYLSLKDGDWFEVISCIVVRNAQEFTAAAANTNYKYIYVAEDIDYGTASASINTDKIVLGNGHKFTAGGNTTGNYGINVRSGKVVLNDLVMENCGGINVQNEGSRVEVNNCDITVKYAKNSRHLFYAAAGGEIVVNSGNFEFTRTKSRYLCDDTNGRIYVMGGTFADMVSAGYSPVYGYGTVVITGGKFQVNVSNYKFDPTAWVPADTHKVERVGDYMEVSAK